MVVQPPLEFQGLSSRHWGWPLWPQPPEEYRGPLGTEPRTGPEQE